MGPGGLPLTPRPAACFFSQQLLLTAGRNSLNGSLYLYDRNVCYHSMSICLGCQQWPQTQVYTCLRAQVCAPLDVSAWRHPECCAREVKGLTSAVDSSSSNRAKHLYIFYEFIFADSAASNCKAKQCTSWSGLVCSALPMSACRWHT